METALLSADGLHRGFAGVAAVDGASLELTEDEVVGLIGPNGAGKSTIINMLSGFDHPDSGRVAWQGRDISRASPSRVARLGLVRTFQHMRVFDSLSVRENVETAALAIPGATTLGSLVGTPAHRRAERTRRDLVDALLAGFELGDLANRPATSLPYGDQRRVEIVRALATSPRALLLDEPAAGMDEAEAVHLTDFLADTRRRHPVAILLVEHHLDVVMRLCHRVIVVDQGQVIASGKPEQVMQDPIVIEAYTGQGAA